MSNVGNKVVIITGASSGMGEATALKLAHNGAKLVLAARREDRLQKLQEEIKKSGGQAVYKVTDVTSHEQMSELATFAHDQFGSIDVLINNAGLMPLSALNKRKIEEWDRMVDVNIKGVLYGIYAVLPYMRDQKHGHIINLSSIAGHVVFPGSAVYCATKSAVRDISEGLRMEESPESNIRSTIISPGSVVTELSTHITDEEQKNAINQIEESVGMKPENIAEAIYFAINQPEEVGINEILVRPTGQQL
ncbi:SDR family oxidoreductase [Cytobacillus purgationiresistens]|uniref:NADP-dependent 3-hydroxy acid dehydrogenase YdfG n=1 Tax=Cytobacillus purgationiresistens TaxID=863449 RepID=A0ABU0AIS6_9BACI|nr:SDR family oxidoreductase [Cytobacillus purgationiresistens]MDQ0271167.1 NADP-dependent 3-hydroxy acid dehydrogenase YdfG [Cytobacillus purgationiresistens]